MPRLLSHLLDEAAFRDPQATAIRCDGESLSYEQLARRAYGLAHVLLAAGCRPRDRVAVLLRKSPRVAVGFYGVSAAGAVLVPIDPKSPAEQVVRILRATGTRCLVTEPAKAGLVEEVLETYPDLAIIGLDAAEVAEDGTTSETNVSSTIAWDTVLEAATDRPPVVRSIDLDPAYVLHTSGSTGIPKLIQHTHRSALSFVDWAAKEYDLKPDDRLSNHSSHHTCFATFDYYAAARAGAATVLLTPAHLMMPASLAALLTRERVSIWYSVPTALVQLSLRGGLESHDLSALRWVLFAGETFAEKHLRRLMEQLPEARFSHVYGSTETNVCTYYHLPGAADFSGPLPIGKACSTSRTLVVDEELRPVADGDVGELLVRGSTVMSGYWGERERNESVLVSRPGAGDLDEIYFRTGDRVRVLEDGNLTFVARADLQVKVRGFRVELEEVEAALLTLDSVHEAAAFAVPDGEGSSVIRAGVVLIAQAVGQGPNPHDIVDGLRKILPAHAVPAEVTVLDVMPRTATGKVDRSALKSALKSTFAS